MGLEAAGFISELVATNPTGSDDYATADDHLRLIKSVLQAQFPNFIAAAMNATVAELNSLDGYLGNVADFNILAGAAAGGLTATELLFLNGVTSGIQTQIDGKAPTAHAHTGTEISDLDAADITTGIFANALISAGNITQHEASINHDALLGFVANEHLRWDLDLGATNLHANNSANGALALSSGEVSQLANIGAVVISASDWAAVAALVGVNTGDEPAASETVQGIVERANQAEVDAGTDTTRYVSPATLAGTALGIPDSYPWYEPAHFVTLTNQPSAIQFHANLANNRTKMDLSNATQIRLVIKVTTASSSANSPRNVLRYRTADSSTATDWTLDIGTSEVSSSFSATGIIDTGWVNITALAQVDNVFVGLMMIGGDGVQDPTIAGPVMYIR